MDMYDELGADQPLDSTDAALLTRLALLVEAHDPVPADLVDRIGLALTIDALHAEVAELRLVGEPALALRGDDNSIAAETITFTTDVLTVMITVHVEGDRVRVDGWAVPAEELDIELAHGVTVVSTRSDADGRFAFTDLPRGAARLVLRRVADPSVPVVTPTIEL